MEALARAYGSDSDSDASESGGTSRNKGPLRVFDNYCDSDDDGTENQPYSEWNASNNDRRSVSETNKLDHFKEVPNEVGMNAELSTGTLPKPRLHNSKVIPASCDDAILFHKNYLLEKNHYKDLNVTLNPALMKLQEDGGSFAIKLKNQKEFGNKSVFPSVVDYFNIDPMGSNIDRNTFGAFEYIDRLLMKEDQKGNTE